MNRRIVLALALLVLGAAATLTTYLEVGFVEADLLAVVTAFAVARVVGK